MGLYRKQPYVNDGRDVYGYKDIFVYWISTYNDWLVSHKLFQLIKDKKFVLEFLRINVYNLRNNLI